MAEPEIAEATFDDYDVCARELGVAIAPALGFYGGLGDLAATAAMRDWDGADEICLAYALSSWRPTLGTRATIDAASVRRKGGRLTFLDGRVGLRRDEAPAGVWTFPDPIGAQPVAFEFTTADCVTISSHLTVGAIRECITVAPLADLSAPDLSGPRAVDDIGRSAQTFLLEAIVRRGSEERSVVVTGQDIYAVSAPIVVELTERLLTSDHITGVVAAGAIADPLSVLLALSPNHLAVETDL